MHASCSKISTSLHPFFAVLMLSTLKVTSGKKFCVLEYFTLLGFLFLAFGFWSLIVWFYFFSCLLVMILRSENNIVKLILLRLRVDHLLGITSKVLVVVAPLFSHNHMVKLIEVILKYYKILTIFPLLLSATVLPLQSSQMLYCCIETLNALFGVWISLVTLGQI